MSRKEGRGDRQRARTSSHRKGRPHILWEGVQAEFQNHPMAFTPWGYPHDYVMGCGKRRFAGVIKVTNQMTLELVDYPGGPNPNMSAL